ncbi:MAG TPA: hypothetical protein VFW65_07910 [Pseudonocardiaceae bacterium]|nr:hypothetical protein [Pseudonocardiaceae bacterium]
MAKNMLPMKTGGGIVGKLIWLIVGLAFLMLVIRYPSDVAGWFKDAAHLLTNVVNGIVAFCQHLSH